jgi:tetratricopeptide (TPR) repeat protein
VNALGLLRDQLAQVDRDLDEVGQQLDLGELDEATADHLRATYRSERRELEARIADLESAGEDSPDGPDRRRTLVAVAGVVVALAVVTLVLLNTVEQRQPGELITGGVASDVVAGNVNLDDITNEEMEEVVAANPTIAPMRLALANRYFEAGEFDLALPHYMTVLDQDQDNPEALASVGWMTYLSGRADVAETFVERALLISPNYPEAHWFLGNIRLYGLDDAAGSIEHFERVLEFDGIPDEIRSQAEQSLAAALS